MQQDQAEAKTIMYRGMPAAVAYLPCGTSTRVEGWHVAAVTSPHACGRGVMGVSVLILAL